MTAVDETHPDEEQPMGAARRRAPSDWYWRVALFLSSVAVSAVACVIAIKANEASDRKWCVFVSTLDNAWIEEPPPSESGKNVAAAVKDLRHDFHCP